MPVCVVVNSSKTAMRLKRLVFSDHFESLSAGWAIAMLNVENVVPGAADRSYGIQVAKLAGLPRPVIARAGDVLQRLEAGDQHRPAEDLVDDLPLFSAARAEAPPAATAEPSPLAEALKDLHPDDMSPREALEALYRLKALAAETDGES